MPAKGQNKYGITKELLLESYLEKDQTTCEIAKKYGCTVATVCHYLKHYGIRSKKSPKKGKVYGRVITGSIDDAFVCHLYEHNQMSMRAIGEIVGCSSPSIAGILKESGVKIRHHNDTKRGKTNHLRKEIDSDAAITMYSDGFSMSKISDCLGVSSGTIKRALVENGVKIKSLSDTLKGTRHGKNNSNYKPWLTDEERSARRDNHKSTQWRNSVFERDGYTCLACNDSSGGNLCAHHITAYSVDRKNRWEVSNGATLCKKCHRKFHSTYGLTTGTKKHLDEFIAHQIAQLPK